MNKYLTSNIRMLLLKGYSVGELRQFCQFHEDFGTVIEQISVNPSQAEMVDRIIEYANSKLIFDPLLAWARETNSARYSLHGPYLERLDLESLFLKISRPDPALPVFSVEASDGSFPIWHDVDLPEAWLDEPETLLAEIHGFRFTTHTPFDSTGMTARKFGQSAFQKVFGGEVAHLYRDGLKRVYPRPHRLPIRLYLAEKSLAELPWEFLCDPNEGEAEGYLTLTHNPVIRSLGKQRERINMDPPLRLLLVSGDHNAPKDHLKAELDAINHAVSSLQQPSQLTLQVLWEATVDRFVTTVHNFKPHIVHFMSHGGIAQLTINEHQDSDETLVTRASLMTSLRHAASLRLVVFNGCASPTENVNLPVRLGLAYRLAEAEVPAIVVMQFSPSHQASLVFVETLYQTLVKEGPIEEAVRLARQKLLKWSDSLDWAAPVLYLQARHGYLFEDVLNRDEMVVRGLAVVESRKETAAKTSPLAQTTFQPELPPAQPDELDQSKPVTEQKVPVTLELEFQLGDACFNRGEWEKAVRFWQKVADQVPTYQNVQDLLRAAQTKLTEQQQRKRKQTRFNTLLERAKYYLDQDPPQWLAALDLLTLIQETDATFQAQEVTRLIAHAQEAYEDELSQQELELRVSHLYQRAKDALNKENLPQAIIVLEALELQPLPPDYEDVPDLLDRARLAQRLQEEYAQGEAAFEQGDWDTAVLFFGRVQALDKTDSKVRHRLEMAQIEQALEGRYREGLDHIKAERWREAATALKSVPESPRRRDATLAYAYAEARLHMTQEEWDKAVTQLHSPAAAAYRDAADLLKTARREQGWVVLFKQGRQALDNKRWTEAITAFKALVDQNASNREVAQELLEEARQAAELEQSLSTAERLAKAERWDEALVHIDKAHLLAPTDPAIVARRNKMRQEKEWNDLYNQGLTYARQQQWQEAVNKLSFLPTSYRDASQRLEAAQRQVHLHQLHQQATQAMDNRHWTRAVSLFEQIAQEQAEFPKLVDNLNQARRQVQLERLYQASQDHLDHERWDEATTTLQELVEVIGINLNNPLDQPYVQASALLETARQQQELARINQQAEEALEKHRWEEALRLLEQIASNAPPSMADEARQKFDQAQKQVQLEKLAAQAQQEMQARRWTQALELLNGICQIDETYPNIDNMLQEARQNQARARLYKRALKHENKGELKEAIHCLEELQSEMPEYEDVAERLEFLRLRSNRFTRYAQAEQAIEDRAWNQAVVLLKEIVDEQPDFLHTQTNLDIARRQVKLKALYDEAERLMKATEWSEAIKVLEDLLPNLNSHELYDQAYAQAPTWLDQARREQELAKIYSQAQAALEAEQWDEAIRVLQTVLTGHDDARTGAMLEQAKTERGFAQAFTQAQKAIQIKNWTEAASRLEQALRYKPHHAQAQQLQTEVEQQQVIEQALADGAACEARKDWACAIAAYQRILDQHPNHQEATSRQHQAQRHQTWAELTNAMEKAIQTENWKDATEHLNKLALIDPTDQEVKDKMQSVKKQRRLADWYQQAQASLVSGREDYNRDQLELARKLFEQVVQESKNYQEAAAGLQATQAELSLLGDYILAERYLKAEDWDNALTRLENIEQQCPTGYRNTTAFLLEVRVNRQAAKYWADAQVLLQSNEPTNQALLQVKDKLRQIVEGEPSRYEERARQKIKGIEETLTARLTLAYQRMVKQAEEEKWDQALEILQTIYEVEPNFNDAPDKLKEIIMITVNRYEQESKGQNALETYHQIKKVDQIIQS